MSMFDGYSDPSQREWPSTFPDLTGLAVLAKTIHENAVEKGFWKAGEDRNNGEMLMLMVSELAELLEGLRHGNPPSGHIPEFSSAEEEAADLVIRLLDMTYARKWRLAAAIEAKMAFNAGRPYLHGKHF